jgi:hypothetical protein
VESSALPSALGSSLYLSPYDFCDFDPGEPQPMWCSHLAYSEAFSGGRKVLGDAWQCWVSVRLEPAWEPSVRALRLGAGYVPSLPTPSQPACLPTSELTGTPSAVFVR